MNLDVILGILLPFAGTTLGAAMVFFMRKEMNEKLQKEQTIRIVTTLRQNALKGLISKESPVGRALLGHRAGDRVEITVNPEMKYTVVIRSVEPGEDDASLDISAY